MKKLKPDEHLYFLSVYDRDPMQDRMQQVINTMKSIGTDFYPRRRYPDYIDYSAILTDETATYLLLAFGDVIGINRHI
jgi:hypothetical protein